MVAVGGEGLGDVAGGFGGGAWVLRSRPCPGSARRRGGGRGSPVEPSAKQGEQISGPPKAKVSRPASACSEGGGEGCGGGGGVGGDADVFGGPAVFAAGGEVGVDAAVGGVVGAGDAAVVDAVEDAAFGFGVAGEGGLAGDQVGLDVIAAGVGGGDELIGAAVEEPGGAGLLADVGVGAGVVFELDEGEGGEGVVGAGGGRRLAFVATSAVVVDGGGGEAGDLGGGRLGECE